jgi:hypothetical protein
MFISQKIIISGQYLEMYNYEIPVLANFKRKPRSEVFETSKIKRSDLKKFFSLNRTRQSIRRLVNSNPELHKFLTLTFSDNVRDLDFAHCRFRLFLKKLRRKNKFFKYIAVVEFQKRGAVHYHVLCNLQYMKASQIGKIWGNGFIKVNKIKDINNLGHYISKYLQKDIFDKRLIGRKAYFTSRNINRPIEIVDNSLAKNLISCYNLDNVKPLKKYSFFNDYVGKVDYKIFKI